MTGDTSGRHLKTLDTAIEVVDLIQENGGMSISEIVSATGLARSTIHGYVKHLENADYLVEDNGTFDLGMAFLDKGGYVRIREPQFRTAIPRIETLAEETNERAQFIVEEHGRGTYIHTAIGNNAVQVDSRIGKRVHLHASSAGKSILAHLSRDRVDEIINRHGLPTFTENTITYRDRLYEELTDIRERGYAVSDEESIPALRAVGAPVLANDEVVGGISVSGPAHRIKDEQFHKELPDLLLGVTNELQLRLEYQ